MRLIPLLVEVCEALVLESLELFLASDESSSCIVGVTIDYRKSLLEHSPACIASLSLLLEDHASLGIDLRRIAGNEVRIVMENKET